MVPSFVVETAWFPSLENSMLATLLSFNTTEPIDKSMTWNSRCMVFLSVPRWGVFNSAERFGAHKVLMIATSVATMILQVMVRNGTNTWFIWGITTSHKWEKSPQLRESDLSNPILHMYGRKLIRERWDDSLLMGYAAAVDWRRTVITGRKPNTDRVCSHCSPPHQIGVLFYAGFLAESCKSTKNL